MKHIHYEDENSRYITMGSVEKVSILVTILFGFLLKNKINSNTSLLTWIYLSGFMYACLLGGRSKWRCIQEASCKGPRLFVGFRRWNDHAGVSRCTLVFVGSCNLKRHKSKLFQHIIGSIKSCSQFSMHFLTQSTMFYKAWYEDTPSPLPNCEGWPMSCWVTEGTVHIEARITTQERDATLLPKTLRQWVYGSSYL